MALAVGGTTWLLASSAAAAASQARTLPTVVTTLPNTCTLGVDPGDPSDADHRALARRVDTLVTEAIEDAGLELELRSSNTDIIVKGCPGELELLKMGKDGLVIFPQLIRNGEKWVLRLLAAGPTSKVLHIATQELTAAELDVRTVVLLSELLRAESQAGAPALTATATPNAGASSAHSATASTDRGHSPGRGVLALTSSFLGGAVGYSLQRASGSDDPRLTYPLIALGTGLGLGASMIAADEWNISVGEAWYLNAGMVWPTASGLLLARAYQMKPTTDRYSYGLIGASAGIGLSAFALRMSTISDGGALLTHSGGTTGLIMGGLVDMAIKGSTDYFPWHGMGMGAAIGVTVAGAAATQLDMSSSRVLFVDMSIGLGALTGAALGSPLLFVENDFISARRQRSWLGVVGAGSLVGGGLGWYFTRGMPPDERVTSGQARVWPYATMLPDMAESSEGTRSNPQAGIQGVF